MILQQLDQPFAVIPDIHGNFPYLVAILEDLNSQVKGIITPGDLIGYYAFPNEVLYVLRSIGSPEFREENRAALEESIDKMVTNDDIKRQRLNLVDRALRSTEHLDFHLATEGNHEFSIVNDYYPSCIQSRSRKSMQKTSAWLSDDEFKYLRNLPLYHDVLVGSRRIRIAHANPAEPESDYDTRYDYIYGDKEAKAMLNRMPDEIVAIVGHSHSAGYWEEYRTRFLRLRKLRSEYGRFDKVSLESKNKMIIDAGSAGQPRDDNNKLCYLIVTPEMVYLRSINAVDEHFDFIQSENERLGMPAYQAMRLLQGV